MRRRIQVTRPQGRDSTRRGCYVPLDPVRDLGYRRNAGVLWSRDLVVGGYSSGSLLILTLEVWHGETLRRKTTKWDTSML